MVASVRSLSGTYAAAIREHARRVGMSANEIVPVEDTLIVREDPVAQAEAFA